MSHKSSPEIQKTASQHSSPDLFDQSVELSPTDEMKKYSITCASVIQYRYRNYRYARMEDAIAQAKRDADALSSAEN